MLKMFFILDMSGGYTGIKLYSVCTRTFKFSVLYVPAVCISQKKKKKAHFHVLQPHSSKPAGLLVPCCSDRDATSLNDTDVHVTLSVPASVPLSLIPALPFAPRAMMFVFSRSLPGSPLLATLSSCCPSCLFVPHFWSPFPSSWALYPVTGLQSPRLSLCPSQVTGHLG